MTDDDLNAAHAKAKARSELMLDEELCREIVNAETRVAPREHRVDGFAHDWHAGMPKQEPETSYNMKSARMTDAVEARLMSEIDQRIAAAKAEVERTISEHRAATAEWIKASAQAIVQERKHRDEHDLRLSALLHAVEKLERGLSGDRAKVIDLPALPSRSERRG